MVLWDLLFYEPWFLGLGVLATRARCTTTTAPAAAGSAAADCSPTRR